MSQRESRKKGTTDEEYDAGGQVFDEGEGGVVSRIEESSQVERDITGLENNPTETPHEREKADQASGWNSKDA